MANSVEWTHVSETPEVIGPDECAQDGQTPELGGCSLLIGGCAIEGTHDELLAWLDKAASAVRAHKGVEPDGDMVIEYQGEAYESFQQALDAMPGYGVTITLPTGESFDAILLGADNDAEDGATVRFIRAVDDEYDASRYPPEAVESAVTSRIIVS